MPATNLNPISDKTTKYTMISLMNAEVEDATKWNEFDVSMLSEPIKHKTKPASPFIHPALRDNNGGQNAMLECLRRELGRRKEAQSSTSTSKIKPSKRKT